MIRAELAPKLGAIGLVVLGLALGGCSSTADKTAPSGTTSSMTRISAGSQVELPFTGLNNPPGAAVDAAGNIYVADLLNNRVLKLPAGSNTQIELPPFTGETYPAGWRWTPPATSTSPT